MRAMLESVLGELGQIPEEHLSYAEPEQGQDEAEEVQVGIADKSIQQGFCFLLRKVQKKMHLEADRYFCAPGAREELDQEIENLQEEINYLRGVFGLFYDKNSLNYKDART